MIYLEKDKKQDRKNIKWK